MADLKFWERGEKSDIEIAMFPLILIALGIVLSILMGSAILPFAFVSWAVYTIIPAHKDVVGSGIEKEIERIRKKYEKDKNRLKRLIETSKGVEKRGYLEELERMETRMNNRIERVSSSVSAMRYKAIKNEMQSEIATQTWQSWFKSGIHFVTLCLFSAAFVFSTFPFAKPFGIVVMFIAYFTLGSSVEFGRERMYEFPKILLRPFFGLIIAIAFGIAFSSIFLGVLAFAFLCYVPMPKLKKDEKGTQFINKIVFLVIMIGLGFLAFSNSPIVGLGLDWGTGSMWVFAAFWFISLLAGAFSPTETKPYIGVLMIAVAFFVFTAGVGSQAVGTAFFGEWWPTVHNAFNMVFEPISSAFSGFADMLSRSFLMLTNPMAAAHMITEGTWVTNDLGATGAWGVDIQEFRLGRGGIQDIYVEQPFNAILKVKNVGASDAENVVLGVAIDNERLGISSKDITIRDFGIAEPVQSIGTLKVQGMKQLNLNGIVSCSLVEEHELREKFLPFIGNVSYDYEVDSQLSMEFISEQEWDRLAQSSEWTTREVRSEVSSSPVMLSISTLDQPILEGDAFFIGFALESKKDDSRIERARVEIEYPVEFGDTACGSKGKIIWEPKDVEERAELYCDFHNPNVDLGGTATRTYHVKAKAEYRIVEWETYDSKIAFESGVCAKECRELAIEECRGRSDCQWNADAERCVDIE